eukprot:TRINITY_DN1557_c0_g1_i3.p1 TRINITY_DN1557_c0_g1~~TRINITY_DN1557_c0_g1_i3.p1  ORF type:complete len:393 (-),score=99.40 TRINITY_DN1557_c0_g1_i3:401-1453(-)
MLRSLVGSEMCIRDSINAEYGGEKYSAMGDESPADKPVVPAEGEGQSIENGKDASHSRSPRREKKHKKDRRRDRRRSRSRDRRDRDRSRDRDRDRSRDRRRSRRSRSRRSRSRRSRSRDRRARSREKRSRSRQRDEHDDRFEDRPRSGRMYKDLAGREFRDQRSKQYPSRSRSFGKIRAAAAAKRKKAMEEEESGAAMLVQQMLAKKTNPMLAYTSMLGPTAAQMGLMPPGAGVVPQAAAEEAAEPAAEPTKVLALENAVSAEELKDDDDYKDLLEDMKLEAEKHGSVVEVKIPRPADGLDVKGVGIVFIVFDFEEAASRAMKAMDGRKFGEQVVTCKFMDEAKFINGDF